MDSRSTPQTSNPEDTAAIVNQTILALDYYYLIQVTKQGNWSNRSFVVVSLYIHHVHIIYYDWEKKKKSPLKVDVQICTYMWFLILPWWPSWSFQTVWFQILSEITPVVWVLTAKMCITMSYRRLCEFLHVVTTLLWKLATFSFITSKWNNFCLKFHGNEKNMSFLLIQNLNIHRVKWGWSLMLLICSHIFKINLCSQ